MGEGKGGGAASRKKGCPEAKKIAREKAHLFPRRDGGLGKKTEGGRSTWRNSIAL